MGNREPERKNGRGLGRGGALVGVALVGVDWAGPRL